MFYTLTELCVTEGSSTHAIWTYFPSEKVLSTMKKGVWWGGHMISFDNACNCFQLLL